MKFFKYSAAAILSTGFLFGALQSCERSDALVSNNTSEELKLQEVIIQKEEMPVIITYHLDSIATPKEVDSFKVKFSEEAQHAIFALNRIDPDRLVAGKVLVIPNINTGNFLDYSPFPESFEMLEKIPRAVLISRRVQAFGLYEEGKLIRWGPVSSGKESTPTPAGLFYGNYKAKRKISTVNDSWILPYYFNFILRG